MLNTFLQNWVLNTNTTITLKNIKICMYTIYHQTNSHLTSINQSMSNYCWAKLFVYLFACTEGYSGPGPPIVHPEKKKKRGIKINKS